MTDKSDLNMLRKEISDIDREILLLLQNRFKTVEHIGAVKRAEGLPIVDKQREEKLKEGLKLYERNYEKAFHSVYSEIINQSVLLQEKNRNLYIIGMPLSGKSTLAKRLSKNSIDTDSEIEREENMSISELFTKKGEKHFREVEATVLKKIAFRGNTVVSTGGGIILCKENCQIMKNSGRVVYLDIPIAELICRYKMLSDKGKRPLIPSESALIELYNTRRSQYNSIADITFSSSAEALTALLQ